MEIALKVLPSLITLITLLIAFTYGYGKLNQKIDSLTRDVDRLRNDFNQHRSENREDFLAINNRLDHSIKAINNRLDHSIKAINDQLDQYRLENHNDLNTINDRLDRILEKI
jgi:DNA anti-recombination protein RmuC